MSTQEQSHRHLMRRGTALVAVCGAFMGGVMLLEGEPKAGLASVLFALVSGVLAGLSFLKRPRTHLLGHLLVGHLTLFLACMSLYFGHYDGLAPFALPSLGALATFLVGRKGAVAWTSLALVLQTAVFALPAAWKQNLHVSDIQPIQHHAVVVAATLAVLAIAVAYDAMARTRQEQLEAQHLLAEQARARAEAANRSKSAFLAAMSHEIRTPLNALIGATELLDGSDPEERARLQATIRDAGTTLLGQMGDVLDFSRIEAGALQVNPRPTSPADIVREVCSVVRPRAVDKDLRLELQLPDSPSERMLDPDRLRQILLNLVGNAVKFTERGHVQVCMREEKERLRIQVKDTGPGIPEPLREQIFEPFRQGDEGLSRRHQGYGLGLAISKGLAEAMGGDLHLCESEGGGACFCLELSAPTASASGESRSAALGGVEVLLVEDNPVNRLIARTMLERLGCVVREATNGEEAVHAVIEAVPDVVLMDLQMPVMDGLEATRRIQALDRETPPILALTANAFAEDREAALGLGMVDFLPKPVNQATLAQALAPYAGERKRRLRA